jgi:poly(A) polymerase
VIRNSTKAAQALVALFEGRGHRVWLTGTTARAALGVGELAGLCELITDADQTLCEEVVGLAAAVTGDDHLLITSIGNGTVESVLEQRGITVDALAISSSGEVIDPFHGRDDLNDGVIRTVLPPGDVFRLEPIKLLAVPSIMSLTGFSTSSELGRFAQRDAGNILDTRHDYTLWGRHMNRLLLGADLSNALVWLHETHILQFVMPEVAAMVGFHQTCRLHHKDIWEHTRLVTAKAKPNLVVRWAALCHDIGKVWTRSISKDGKVHFFRHEDHGALLFQSIAHRFGLDEELMERIAYVIRNHSRVNLYQHDWTDSAVRRLIRETGDHLNDLVTFSEADYTTKRQSRIDEMTSLLSDLKQRVHRVKEADAQLPLFNKGIGVAIMSHFKLPPSQTIGDLKHMLTASIRTGDLPERAEDSIYLEWLAHDADAIARIQSAGGTIVC